MRAGRNRPGAWPFALLFLILLATLISYGPAFRAGFFLDDEPNILQVQALHWTGVSLDGIRAVLSQSAMPSRPVANLSFALNHWISGLDPTPFHRANVMIHLAVGLALAWVICLLLGEGRRSEPRAEFRALTAISVAGLFLLHPLNTQAVTYVVQRMTSLATLFFLLALALYLKARRLEHGAAKWFVGAAACWLLAVGSKETAFALPLVLGCYEWAFRADRWRTFLARLPTSKKIGLALAVAVGLLVIVLLFQQLYGGIFPPNWFETFHNREYSGAERVLTQFRVQVLYLGLFFWPAPSRLNLVHQPAISKSLFEPWTTLPAMAICLAVIALGLWLARRRPRYGFPILAYAALHLIESGPVNLELVFEHRMYLPMTMLAVLLATAIHDFLAANVSRGTGGWRSTVPIAAGLILMLPLALATYARNTVWRTPLSMWQDVVAKSPRSYRAQNNLANCYFIEKDFELALVHYQAAAELSDRYVEVFYNVAITLELLGRSNEAVPYFEHFIAVAPRAFEPQIAYARLRISVLKQGRSAQRDPP